MLAPILQTLLPLRDTLRGDFMGNVWQQWLQPLRQLSSLLITLKSMFLSFTLTTGDFSEVLFPLRFHKPIYCLTRHLGTVLFFVPCLTVLIFQQIIYEYLLTNIVSLLVILKNIQSMKQRPCMEIKNKACACAQWQLETDFKGSYIKFRSHQRKYDRNIQVRNMSMEGNKNIRFNGKGGPWDDPWLQNYPGRDRDIQVKRKTEQRLAVMNG